MDIFSPIQNLADFLTYQVLNISSNTPLADSINFFIYDVVKIGILFILINYLMAIVRYYLPTERIRDILKKRKWFGLDYLLAALLGMITPFCSCSSIPLFVGFLSAGIPMGITFTFLISSPLINEASLFLFPSVFGLKATILYNMIGIMVSILGGILIQKLGMEKYIKPEFLKFKSKKQITEAYHHEKIPFGFLLKHWTSEAMEITRKVFPYVVLGVGLGAVIHGFVPENLISKYLSIDAWYIVPIATLLGVPIYANSISVIPIIEALVGKGIPMGTALAFMSSVVALSLPEALILKSVMKAPLIITFFTITITGIILMGYFFNFIY